MKYRHWFIVIVVHFIIILLDIVFGLYRLEKVIDAVVVPIQSVAREQRVVFSRYIDFWFSLNEIHDENIQLKQRIQSFAVDKNKLSNAIDEIHSLREQLKAQPFEDQEYIVANILFSTNQKKIVVDVGTEEGVEPNAAVLVNNWLVGRVESVSRSRSWITYLHEDIISVPVHVVSTGENEKILGVVENDHGSLVLSQVENSFNNLAVGDFVATSGIASVFPRGLIVGQVRSIESGVSDLYLNATLEQYFLKDTVNVLYILK